MNIDSTPAVELEGVSRVFGDVVAVEALACTVERGAVLGMVGHTGSGKSTALRLINGVLRPTTGRVRVFGLDPVTHGPQVRRHSGVLLSKPPVDHRLTGREHLGFITRLHGLERDAARERIDELSVSFHLDDRLDEPIGHYSSGMRQRLALAGILLPDPSLLLLDEPTAALEAMAAHGVRQLVRDLAGARKRTVILATQDLSEAAELCDRIAVLQRGRMVALGTPADIVERVAARGLDLVIADHQRLLVADVAAGRGYTVEPVDTGRVCVHGVAYDDVPGLVRVIVEAGVQLYGLTIEPPTLTDFYLALHRDVAVGQAGGGATPP